MRPPTTPVALDKACALALWLIAKTAAMPRAHRFTLGDRIYSQSLDLVTAVTQATFSRDKSRALETAGDGGRDREALGQVIRKVFATNTVKTSMEIPEFCNPPHASSPPC